MNDTSFDLIVLFCRKKSMAYKALDIANKLLAKATDVCGGDLMSNMKLQKMLYYEQGYHLAALDVYKRQDLYRGDEAWYPCVCGKAACQNFL